MTSDVSADVSVPISADALPVNPVPTDDELLAARLVPLRRPGQWASDGTSVGVGPPALLDDAVPLSSQRVIPLRHPGRWIATVLATGKKGSGLARPTADAINHLIQNGDYGKWLAAWNLSGEAVRTSQANPPGLPLTNS
jgi:hypothetical protein